MAPDVAEGVEKPSSKLSPLVPPPETLPITVPAADVGVPEVIPIVAVVRAELLTVASCTGVELESP